MQSIAYQLYGNYSMIKFISREIDAFIYDATPLEYQVGIDKDCNLITVGERYAMTGYGVGVPRGSDLLGEINDIILQLQENGKTFENGT